LIASQKIMARTPQNNYEILDVSRDANADAIRFAYGRALDMVKRERPEDAGAIAAIRKAYETLADEERRKSYDSWLDRNGNKSAAPAGAGNDGVTASRAWIAWTIGAVALAVGAGTFLIKRKNRDVSSSPKVIATSVTQLATNATSGNSNAQTQPIANNNTNVGPTLTPEQLFSKLSPSVARITVKSASGTNIGVGSGVVISASHIITNCHVALQGPDLSVRVGNENLNATVDIADQEFDLCRLSVSQLNSPPVTTGKVADLRTGQRVFAIGAPQGLDLTLSDGLVSALREIPEGTVIQTSAPVSPGSSGGGLFDATGRLVGIVTFQHRFGQNLNFAIPVDWIDQMRTRTSSTKTAVTASAPAAKVDDLRETLIASKWYCAGSLTGFNGEMAFGRDGYFTYSRNEKLARGNFSVNGKTLILNDESGNVSAPLESSSPEKLVFNMGGGNRMVCEKR
jgi:serine protease Do